MLHIVPIEPLEERYSAQWARWWPEELARLGVRFNWYPAIHPAAATIQVGEFLDVFNTNIVKAQQLKHLIQNIKAGVIKDGDVILFHDLWFPGLEALFYVRDAAGINFRIAGLLHAGTYDANDFLARKGMTRWAQGIERAWFDEVDMIFVATRYHADLLGAARNILPSKVKVTGFPIYLFDDVEESINTETKVITQDRQDIVVFPHRLAPEKQPEMFDRLAYRLGPLMPRWRFVRTKDVCKSKSEYFELLGKAKVAVSFALQETWGIAQQEALFFGCIPIAPNRLSYPEMYPEALLYDGSVDDCARLVKWAADNYEGIVKRSGWFSYQRQQLLDQGAEAIEKIMKELELI